MVLLPGDSVSEDSCERVGNFPHAILTDPDSLQLDPDVFGAVPATAAKKDLYIQAFDANDLIVCEDGEPFAKQGQPYILHLNRKGDEPPEPSDADKRWLFALTCFGQGFREQTVCPGIFICGRCIYRSRQIHNPCGHVFYWTTDIGSMSFSAKMHEYMENITNTEECTINTNECDCYCFTSECEGTIEIESFWDAETMNHAYLNLYGIPWWEVIVARIRTIITGPFGSKSSSWLNITSYGISYGQGQIGIDGSWTCYDDGNPYHKTEQTGSIGFYFTANELARWQHNWQRVEKPECAQPPPGKTWPVMIDDPSHSNY
jgi:hypothetical protein